MAWSGFGNLVDIVVSGGYMVEGSLYQGVVPPEVLMIALVGFLLLAAVYDWFFPQTPNGLFLNGVLVAFLLQALFYAWAGVFAAAGGGVVGLVLMLPFCVMGGLDVRNLKLLAMAGTFLGPQYTFYAVLFGLLIGGVWAMCLVACNKTWRRMTIRSATWPTRHAPGRRPDAFPPVVDGIPGGGLVGAFAHLPYGVVIVSGVFAVLLLV